MEKLKTYLRGLRPRSRAAFARRCGTTLGHLRNIVYGQATCSAVLAIDMERESLGELEVEYFCPKADWAYIRGTRKRLRKETYLKHGRKRGRKKS